MNVLEKGKGKQLVKAWKLHGDVKKILRVHTVLQSQLRN